MKITELPVLIELWLSEYNSDECADERRIEIERLIEDAELTLADKCDAIADWNLTAKEDIAAVEGRIAHHKSEIERHQSHKSALENTIERNKRFCALLLRGEKLKTALHSYYYQSRPHVVVEDITKLPSDYLRFFDPEPRKDELAKALKLGETIPGAFLEAGIPTLVIR